MQFPHPGRARRQLATGARASTARVAVGRSGGLAVERAPSCQLRAVRPVSTVRDLRTASGGLHGSREVSGRARAAAAWLAWVRDRPVADPRVGAVSGPTPRPR